MSFFREHIAEQFAHHSVIFNQQHLSHCFPSHGSVD